MRMVESSQLPSSIKRERHGITVQKLAYLIYSLEQEYSRDRMVAAGFHFNGILHILHIHTLIFPCISFFSTLRYTRERFCSLDGGTRRC